VQRDRIQSGMSAGTIVMQTDIQGGTMHTVRFAVGQDRMVFAPVPPAAHAHEPTSQGLHALLGPSAEFAVAVAARGAYASELQALGAGSVAVPIAGRADYSDMERRLDQMLLLRSHRAVRAKMPLDVTRTIQVPRRMGMRR
jgi:DNA processing protein